MASHPDLCEAWEINLQHDVGDLMSKLTSA